MALTKWIALALGALLFTVTSVKGKNCKLRPMGAGRDDTNEIESAIKACGHSGDIMFENGTFNITRRMLWDLDNAHIDFKGTLSFQPNIDHWLNESNTFQVVFIQSQSLWFVVTGKDFVIDGHGTGGIEGNGQGYSLGGTFSNYSSPTGWRWPPISLTLWRVKNAVVRGFKIQSPPFWANTFCYVPFGVTVTWPTRVAMFTANAVVESTDVLYENMVVNATNTDPTFSGQNIVWNTDGINAYRSSRITMLNWDVTCGDDCIAIKGNSTNITAQNFICRGGEGIAFGSLGQYDNLTDLVSDVLVENVQVLRLPLEVQPNNDHGIYFKSWDGSLNNSVPPTGGGGGPGLVKNVVFRNLTLDRVATAVQTIQDFGGGAAIGSRVEFEDMRFEDTRGTTNDSTIVNLACSSAVGCSDLFFENFDVRSPAGTGEFICENAHNISGLQGESS